MKKILSAENSIYAGVILLPLYLIRFKIFGIPTNLWELWVALVSMVIMYVPILRRKLVVIFKKEKLIPICFGMILTGLFISTIIGRNYLAGLGIIKSWLLFPFWFYILAKAFIPEENRKNIFIAYIVSSFIVALISLGFLFSDHLTYDGRLRAFFNSPNYLAMYLAPGVITLLAQFPTSSVRQKMDNFRFLEKLKNSKIQNILFFPPVVIILAFYSTYSYAAWISVSVALMIMNYFQKKISIKKVGLIGVIAVILIFLQTGGGKWEKIVNFDSRSSLSSRIMIWKSAGKMLENNWLWGIGPGNFQKIYLEYQIYYPPYLEWAVPHPHNIFLALWLYSGLIGLIGFVGLMILFFKQIISSRNKNPARTIALGIMIYILIHGLIDTTYFKNDLSVVFWLCFLGL